MRKLIAAAALMSALLPSAPASAGHFTCAMTGHQQPGVAGLFVGVDVGFPGWVGPCVELRQGNGSTVAYFSIKMAIDGTNVAFGMCTDTAGECPAILYRTGVHSIGGPASCGIGACWSGTGLNVNNPDPSSGPTVELAGKTGIQFVLGGGVSMDPENFVCVGVCVKETKVYVGSFEIYVDGGAPLVTIPVCAQAGDFTTDCPTIA